MSTDDYSDTLRLKRSDPTRFEQRPCGCGVTVFSHGTEACNRDLVLTSMPPQYKPCACACHPHNDHTTREERSHD